MCDKSAEKYEMKANTLGSDLYILLSETIRTVINLYNSHNVIIQKGL